MSARSSRATILCTALIAISACTTKEMPKSELGAKAAADSAGPVLTPASKAALDSGNALFRKKAYAAARAQYETAAKGSPLHAAPLFGIYMVGRATNNQALADSAMVGIRARNAVPPHDLPDSAALRKIHSKVQAGVKAGTKA